METQNGRHPTRDTGPESSNPLAHTGQTANGIPGCESSVEESAHLSALPEPFQILESTADGRRVITPRGELDLSTGAQLKERLAGSCDTVLDLSDLSFIDSTGIYVLVSTAERARSEAWEFTVRNPQPAVLRVIELIGLAEHLCIEPQTPPEEDAKHLPL